MRARAALRWSALALVVLLAGARAEAAEFTKQDAAAIRKMFDDSAGHLRAKNWTAWSAQWADDGLLYPLNAPGVKGRAAILAWGQAFPAMDAISFSNVQAWGEGNLAYATSAYALTIKGSPPDTGKQLVVCRRSSTGKWEVVAVSFNSDLPAPGQTRPGTPKE